MDFLIYGLVFAAVLLFALAGIELFGHGWTSYEQRYVAGASRSLEAIWLTIPPQQLLYLSVASAILLGLAAGAVARNPYVGIPFALIGFLLPKGFLILKKRRRDRLFDQQLVHALGNMVSSLRSGMSLVQSVDLVAREMDSPLRQEFGLVVQQTRLGVTLEDALGQLSQRMPSPDLDLVVTSILISKEVGGNLSEVFEKISGTIRERQRIEGRIRALSAMGRLQGIIMAALPFVIGFYLYCFHEGYIRPLFTHPIGWLLMAGSAAWMAIGGYLIHKILSIDV